MHEMAALSHAAARLIFRTKTRRILFGSVAGGLLLKNSLFHFSPSDSLLPLHGYPTSSDYMWQKAIVLLNECSKESNVRINSVRPFISMTRHVCSAGFFAGGLNQSLIGLPRNFFCRTAEEVSSHDLRLRRFGKTLMFEELDPTEIKLLESMIYSENSKKFVIAWHLSYLRNNWAFYQCALPPFFTLVGYYLSYHLPRLLFRAKPVTTVKILGFAAFGMVIAWLMCRVSKAALQCRICDQADMEAASISDAYAAGGVELYDKLLQENKAMRILLGRRGENMYTNDGDLNETSLLGLNGRKITLRREAILNLKKNKDELYEHSITNKEIAS